MNQVLLKTFQLGCALFLVAACADRDIVPRELVGIWGLTKSSAANLPIECRDVHIEFTSNGRLITVNGQFNLVVKVSVTRKSGGFVVGQTIVEHNDKPNCQGRSAHFILSNFVHEVYFELLNDAVLRQYIWTKKSTRFVEYRRISPKRAGQRERESASQISRLLAIRGQAIGSARTAIGSAVIFAI